MATTRRRDEAARSSGNRLFGKSSERGSQSVSEAGVPLLFPDDLAASSRRRVVAIAREARPLDLRTRPMWSVRAMRRLMTRPAPRACVEAPVVPRLAGTAALQAQSAPTQARRAPTQAQGAPAGAVPAVTPRAPVRVGATPPPPPCLPTPATPAATAAGAPASGPARTPTAPLKNGRAYDWTGLP